jgi:hypothetical protein
MTDITFLTHDGGANKRLRDMGDGTYAEVVVPPAVGASAFSTTQNALSIRAEVVSKANAVGSKQ